MKTEYLDFYKQLLNMSNLDLIRKESFIEEDIINKKACVELRFDMTINDENKINLKSIFTATIIFNIFDVFIDSNNSHLIDKTFRQKCMKLPQNNDIEKIQKNFYRLFKTIRNALIHDNNSIKKIDDNYIIDYYYNDTHFHLEIKNDILIKLYEATVLMIEYDEINGKRNKKYTEGLFVYYNNMVINNVTLEDDIKDKNFLKCKNIPLDTYRETSRNSEYEVDNIYIIIKNSTIPYNQARDFAFEYDGNSYIVPEEYLTEHKIKTSELSDWKVAKDYFEH